MTTEEDKAYIRSLPLLLTGGAAFVGGAFFFWKQGDSTASIAAMTLGVALVSMWTVTEIIRIHEERKRRRDGDTDPPDE
jgi:predicted membrane protein